MSFKYIIVLLILCIFANTCVESYSIPQVLELHARDDYTEIFKKLCGGFNYTNPKANGTIPAQQVDLKVKNGDVINVTWAKNPDAEVLKVVSCDLYTDKGLSNPLWNKTADFVGTVAWALVKVVVPAADESLLPKRYFLRSFGSTKNGPQCNCYRYD
ncbi:1497_t:CDS:2 [Acaulospora morrowiae]|uniref:1497_t:CDS:1 n=1 Tax=Acaulospora morrowiae TaxID=94023 RepID=A0A9N9E5K5_9GLOM|nr:1497_t:CDS:2 [Acaulospora morrowiae]